MNLRDYQKKAVDLLWRYFETNKGNPVLEAPTGSGKSVIQAAFIRQAVEAYPQTRAIALCHVKELIEQNAMAFIRLCPGASVGIHSASLNSRDVRHPIIFAGVQSAARKADELGYFDLAFVDEAHLVPHKNNGQYRALLDRLRLFNPRLKVVGFTATPYRLGGGLLTEGDDRLFTDLIGASNAGMAISDLLAEGYLAPLTTALVATQLSTQGVQISKGDYAIGELARAVTAGGATERALEEVLRFGSDRKGWLLFATTVEHGEQVETFLRERGIAVRMVTGNTPGGVRDQVINQYKRGDLRALVNVNVLTTGFDAPHTDLLAFLRPTKSPGLYLQMAGRGMRIAPGKTDCLVLDFAGNIAEHGPVDDVRPPKRRGKRGEQAAPMRECDTCGALMPPALRQCPGCGKVFELRGITLDAAPSTLAILSQDAGPQSFEPTRARITIHRKDGKPPSLRVDWYGGMRRMVTEWVCLFHGGYPGEKAHHWWYAHVGGDYPSEIEEACRRANGLLRMPASIAFSTSTKFPTIVRRKFDDGRSVAA